MSRNSELKRARINLAQAVLRSSDDHWLGAAQHLKEARRCLEQAGCEQLGKRVRHALGLGATTADARREMREVMQLIDATDAVQGLLPRSHAEAFATKEVYQ